MKLLPPECYRTYDVPRGRYVIYNIPPKPGSRPFYSGNDERLPMDALIGHQAVKWLTQLGHRGEVVANANIKPIIIEVLELAAARIIELHPEYNVSWRARWDRFLDMRNGFPENKFFALMCASNNLWAQHCDIVKWLKVFQGNIDGDITSYLNYRFYNALIGQEV